MPAVALSRVGARVVESGPDGENLAAGTWQRLEALPDPLPPKLAEWMHRPVKNTRGECVGEVTIRADVA